MTMSQHNPPQATQADQETSQQASQAVPQKASWSSIQERIIDLHTWFKFMLGVVFLFSLFYLPIIFCLIFLLQFFYKLINGEVSSKLEAASKWLQNWVLDILEYSLYSSDRKPFPFAEVQDRQAPQ